MEKDDFPQYTARAPSPDDFDELTGMRPPLPARPGSRGNPFTIDDEESGNHRDMKRRKGNAVEPTNGHTQFPQSDVRSTATSSSSNHLSVTSPLARQPAYPAPAPAPAPKRKPTTRSSTSKSPRSREQVKRNLAHKHSPVKASPLSQVAYRAPSERPVSPTPAGPSTLYGGYAASRQDYEVSVSMVEDSSDSDSDYD